MEMESPEEFSNRIGKKEVEKGVLGIWGFFSQASLYN
jgi:hypothetical protein